LTLLRKGGEEKKSLGLAGESGTPAWGGVNVWQGTRAGPQGVGTIPQPLSTERGEGVEKNGKGASVGVWQSPSVVSLASPGPSRRGSKSPVEPEKRVAGRRGSESDAV